MAINLDCPECDGRLTLDLQTSSFYCPHCGFRPSTGLDERAAEIRARGPRPAVHLSRLVEVEPRAESLFYSAHDHLHAGEPAKALDALRDALEVQRDFPDAHLWIARISTDPQEQRDHLDTLLAYHPGHGEAVRLLLVLDGRLTPEQAAGLDSNSEPVIRSADSPVAATAALQRCPRCGGRLGANAEGLVECPFCGHRVPQPAQADPNGDSLVAALLERRAAPVRWQIAERVLHCNACGAERTLGSQLATRCAFCGSAQVIVQDALDSFEQPEGVIPFRISREDAGQRIKEQLRRFSERVKRLVDDNRVRAGTLQGVYLPFWVFDGMVQVSKTVTREDLTQDRYQSAAELLSAARQRIEFQDGFFDIAVCASDSLPRELIERLMQDMRLSGAVAYNPALLAEHSAEIYTLDFDRAALEARSRVSAEMRRRHGHDQTGSITTTVFAAVQNMQFRLLLLPIWVSNLLEVDDDRRLALVNGHTGAVVLGPSQKPPR